MLSVTTKRNVDCAFKEKNSNKIFDSHSVRGMEIMTPLPVPIHRRLHDTMRAVIRTNEKPSFPVPERKTETVRLYTISLPEDRYLVLDSVN